MKLKAISLLLLFVASVSLWFGGENWYQNATPPEGFVAPVFPEEDIDSLGDIFSQPFTYLAEGGQSYVFVSADGNFVLKFFKFHRFCPPWYAPLLPPQQREKVIARRQKKLDAILEGHQIAYELHRQGSGLLYVQLKPSHFDYTVEVVDKKGRSNFVELGKLPFVLQERGETLQELFTRLMERDDKETLGKKKKQVLALYQEEYNQGIRDADHGVMHNIGFVGEHPVHLDVGRFVKNERMKDPNYSRQDLQKVAGKMDTWIDND